MLEKQRILITGGAGFIGSHLAERLAPANELTIFDINLDNSIRYTGLGDEVRLVEGDVRDASALTEVAADYDFVLHLASVLGVKVVIDNARTTIDTILDGTRNVLELARKSDRLKRFINISTSEIYGNAPSMEEGDPASVGTANDARLCYASAKLMGEHIVWAYQRDFGVPAVNIRPFNVYGPRQIVPHAICLFVVKALAGRDLTLYGDGSHMRSWCYIDDFCQGILACLENDSAAGHDFNLGNPVTATTNYDLAHRIVRLTGSESRITTAEHPFSDFVLRALTSQKARNLLGYQAKFDIDRGLKPTIDWYRQHAGDFQAWL